MRPPRFRFRLRTLMALVAAVALGLGAALLSVRMRENWLDYRSQAVHWGRVRTNLDQFSAELLSDAEEFERRAEEAQKDYVRHQMLQSARWHRGEAGRQAEDARRAGRLEQYYRDAMARPWAPPPEPRPPGLIYPDS